MSLLTARPVASSSRRGPAGILISRPTRTTGVGHSPVRTSSYANVRPIPNMRAACRTIEHGRHRRNHLAWALESHRVHPDHLLLLRWAPPHYLRKAIQIWTALQCPYETARTRVLVGRGCAALDDAESSAKAFDAARRAFAELRTAPALEELNRLDTARRTSGGLTGREAEVLRLVAAGKSNAQIATALGLSERTVARHMSNIFTKIDVPSRTAAAANRPARTGRWCRVRARSRPRPDRSRNAQRHVDDGLIPRTNPSCPHESKRRVEVAREAKEFAEPRRPAQLSNELTWMRVEETYTRSLQQRAPTCGQRCLRPSRPADERHHSQPLARSSARQSQRWPIRDLVGHLHNDPAHDTIIAHDFLCGHRGAGGLQPRDGS